MSVPICDHCKAKLKPEHNKISGTRYRCKKCGCLYSLIIVTNDKACYAKRYPPTTQPIPKKEKKK